MRIVVVGAGVFGASAAAELRRRGHQVVLCDPGPLPHPRAESTDISKVVRMDYADGFYMDLMAEALPGWHEWNRRWGVDFYHEVGFLVLSRDDIRPGSFEHAALAGLERRGHAFQRLGAADIARRYPAWASGGYRDGYLNPRAGWAESARVVERLLAEARDAGVKVRDGDAVAALLEGDAGVRGVVTAEGTRLAADVVLVAAGSWTPVLVPHLRDRLWSTAQTVFHFRAPDSATYRPPLFTVWAADIGAEGWYGFPALADGTLKIANHGVGRRVDADDPRLVPAGEEERFRSFLRRSLPGLAQAPIVGRRVCLYSDSADGDFFIDRDPARAGLVVAAGGSGHGFKFAPVLGGIIADVVERRPNRWAERFRWRDLAPAGAGRK